AARCRYRREDPDEGPHRHPSRPAPARGGGHAVSPVTGTDNPPEIRVISEPGSSLRFTPVELAEIRSAFRERIKRQADPKTPRRMSAKRAPIRPVLALDPGYDDAKVLTPGEVAGLFDVAARTARRWAAAGVLPSFRTPGGNRRFRWGELRAAVESRPTQS